MLWLAVYLPLLPLEVFCGRSDRPTVVIDERSRVLLRNDAAITAGIAANASLATAHSIVPGLLHHRRSPEQELERLRLLGDMLYGLSARVSLVPPADPDTPGSGVVLEIGGSLKLYDGAEALCRRAERLCRELGHEVSLRSAKTPLAALALARSGVSRLRKVPLADAALEPGRLTPERIERFANMGIHTLGQLMALPRRGLVRRFGDDLVDFLDRLTGDAPDPRRCIQPAERFRVDLHLLEPLNSQEALAFPMQRLLGDLHHWLVARQLGTELLRWQLTGSGGERMILPVRFARPQQSRQAFLDISRLQLAETELPEDVISLTLEARRLAPWSAASRGLFGKLPGLQTVDDASDLAELVDQLRARLGRDACHGLAVQDQHTPERAWARSTPLPRGTAVAHAAGGAPSGGDSRPSRRPLWLFDPPRPLDPRRIVLLEGPERIHTGWWQHDGAGDAGPGQARDYYVARHQSGAQCWVFADPWNRWFLHGYFA
ncbi:MAG TPA: DNA polymerase Y family protein [Pseudomonadales bacterium]